MISPPRAVLRPALLASAVVVALGATSTRAAPPELPAPRAAAPRALDASAPPTDVATRSVDEAAVPLSTRVPVPGDRPVQVAHGAPGDPRAIVYLHGVCGRVEAFRAWERAAVRHGTVIALLGDAPCEGTSRSSWGADLVRIDARVVAALRAVGAARGAPLDDADVTVIGYSQGSLRAAALARRFPARYRRVVIAASPTTPAPAGLSPVRAALVGGGLDRRQHLFDAARAFRAAGLDASYFELPGAHHGEYGPEAERAMGEVLDWLFDASPASAAPANALRSGLAPP